MSKTPPRRTKAARKRSAAPPDGPPVDRFKRFHLAVALAPVFAREWFREDSDTDYVDLAAQCVRFADAIARRLEQP